MIAPKPTSRDRRLDADRFYWATLDTSALRRPTRRQLDYLFEAVLPVDVEAVHAVYLPLGRHRVAACGMLRSTLDTEVADGATVTLGPADVPAFLDAPVEAASVNLLTGDYESTPVRTLRRTWTAVLVITILLAGLLLAIGLERRTRELAEGTARLEAARQSVLQGVLGEIGAAGPLPPEAKLTAVLRQLERTRRDDVAVHIPTDAAPSLAAVLAHWPADVPARVESMVVTTDAVTIRGVVPETTHAQRLADALATTPAWRLEQPQVTAGRDGVSFVIRLEASAARETRR